MANQPLSIDIKPETNRLQSRAPIAVCLGILAAISAFLGIFRLDKNPYVLDEMWTVEITMAHGTVHQHLPLNKVLNPPPFYSLTHAAPWWQLWTHMEITHPPLYAILLRWWEDLFGDSDQSGRLFSAVAAVMAVWLLFDVVRLQAGPAPAMLAGLLMAVACPQVEYSRITRGYTELTAAALFTADALVRIQIFGLSRRRIACFTLGLFATAFSHYFACGTLLAILIYSLWNLPAHRRTILRVYILIGLLFAVAWAPFMWQQRHLFAVDDPATAFLSSGMPNHFRVTLLRVLVSPIVLMFPLNFIPTALAAVLGGAVYFLPLISPLVKRSPGTDGQVSTNTQPPNSQPKSALAFWGLWLIGTIAIVSGMDFARKTDHLYFIRYILLAGPAVYALIPLGFSLLGRRASLIATSIAIAGCLYNLPGVYALNPADPRQIVHNLITPPTPSDLLIVASAPDDVPNAQVEMLRLDRYINPIPCPIAMLAQQASPEVLAQVRRSRFVYLLARGSGDTIDYRTYLPNCTVIDVKTYPGLGKFWILQPNRK